MSLHAKFTVAAASLAVILLLAGTEARATQTAKRNAESATKEADEGPEGAAGQKAAVDAAGHLRPVTPEEARTLTEGVARHVDQSSEGLTEVYHQSGAVSIDLDDRFQSVSMARVAVDGSVSTRCVTTRAEAERFLGQGVPAPARVAASGVAPAKEKPQAPDRAPNQAPAKAKAKLTTTPAPLEEK